MCISQDALQRPHINSSTHVTYTVSEFKVILSDFCLTVSDNLHNSRHNQAHPSTVYTSISPTSVTTHLNAHTSGISDKMQSMYEKVHLYTYSMGLTKHCQHKQGRLFYSCVQKL